MFSRAKTPLALKNLTHDWRRLLLAVGGVGFAVLLMGMQIAFERALFESTVALLRHVDADLAVVNRDRFTMIIKETFSNRRLIHAQSYPDVVDTTPIYIETARSFWRPAGENSEYSSIKPEPLRVIAFDPAKLPFDFPELKKNAAALQFPLTCLFDEKTKREFELPSPFNELELSGYRLSVIDTISLGTDFSNDGNLFVSSETLRRVFAPGSAGDAYLDFVDLGLIRLKPGADPGVAQREIEAILPDDVKVLTRDELIEMELKFWRQSTPIGYIFRLGVLLGFIVGVIICYQILYTDIEDHMGEFATLKAIGYLSGFFVKLVLTEAVLLSLWGFIPGVLACQLLCMIIAKRTGLLLQVTMGLALAVLALAVVMCICSGLLSLRKLLNADPAELF